MDDKTNSRCVLTLRITPDEKEAFAQFCKEQDLSMSQGVRRAMKEYIKNHSNEEES